MNADIVVRSVAGTKFTQEVENGRHQLLADEPEAAGGADKGPSPYEWLLEVVNVDHPPHVCGAQGLAARGRRDAAAPRADPREGL
jgi:hypothetical protein